MGICYLVRYIFWNFIRLEGLMTKLEIAMDIANRIRFVKDKNHKRELVSQWCFLMKEYLK